MISTDSRVIKKEVKNMGRKLVAFDIEYSSVVNLDMAISNIIQNYNTDDAMASVPTILTINTADLKADILDKINLLDTESVILAIKASELADRTKTNTVKSLADAGYKICIDIGKEDKNFSIAQALADLIRINIKDIGEMEISINSQFQCNKLACNVDTPEDYILAESANIELYEGNYICRTIEVDIPNYGHSGANYLSVVALINSGVKYDKNNIAKVISRDALLSAQVIRLSNSIHFSPKDKISNIADAVDKIGLDRLKKWLLLLQFSRHDTTREELIKESYARALFCVNIAKMARHNKSVSTDDAYLIGLFSKIEILTGKSMNNEIKSLNLGNIVENALLYRDGSGGMLLNLAIAFEENNWDQIDKYSDAFKLNRSVLFKCYYDCITKSVNEWNEIESIDKRGVL